MLNAPVALPTWPCQKEVVVNPMGVLDMGVNVMSVRDSWKQHHHSLEAGERWGPNLISLIAWKAG